MVVPDGLWFDGLLSPVMRRRPATIADRKVSALWDLAARAGAVAVTGGWETDLDLQGPAPPAAADRRRAIAAEFMDGDPVVATDPAAAGLLDEVARALAADDAAARVLDEAAAIPGGGVVAVSFPGIDRVAHHFLRGARPEAFGDVSDRERERDGQVLARYYERVEALVARGLALAGRDGWLFVVSAHGMQPAPLGRRLLGLALGQTAPGAHAAAPAGFLLARGPEIRAGATFARAPASDVVPTALYLLGLPIARDLDGSIIEQVLEQETRVGRPAVVVDSYGPWP
jgi:hypothetical protein